MEFKLYLYLLLGLLGILSPITFSIFGSISGIQIFWPFSGPVFLGQNLAVKFYLLSVLTDHIRLLYSKALPSEINSECSGFIGFKFSVISLVGEVR